MPAPPSAVVQPSFAPGRAPPPPRPAAPPAAAAETAPAQASAGRGLPPLQQKPPHAATVAQKKSVPGQAHDARPPHPATTAQKKSIPGQAQAARPPHPATIGRGPGERSVQRASAPARPPHPATLPRGARSAQPAMERSVSPAPPGFLRNASWERGQTLPASVQRRMADRFGGADFSAVRVHEGRDAETLGALAFTTGESIYFARGQYRPGTRSGDELLGKQLAYVLQQRAGRVKNPFGSGVAVVRDPALEDEAARIARR